MIGLIITFLSALILCGLILYYPIPAYIKCILIGMIIILFKMYLNQMNVMIVNTKKSLRLDRLKKKVETYDELCQHLDFTNVKKGILDIKLKEGRPYGLLKNKQTHLIGLAIYDEILESQHIYDHPFLRLKCNIYMNKQGQIAFAALSDEGQITLLKRIKECSMEECANLLEIFTADRIHSVIYAEDVNHILDILDKKYTFLLEYALKSIRDKDTDKQREIASDEHILDEEIEMKPWHHFNLTHKN